MRSVPYAMIWQLVRPHRVTLVLYVFILLAIVDSLAATRHFALGGAVAVVWIVGGVLHFIGVSTQPDADIAGPNSCYPRSLFVLPVRTLDLVLWPMLVGIVACAGSWSVVEGIAVRIQQSVMSVVWQTSMIAAVLTSLQALFWSPMRFGFLRIVVAMAVIGGAVTFGFLNPLAWSSSGLAVAYAAVTALAFSLAMVGVERARRSEAGGALNRHTIPAEKVKLLPEFRTAMAAQLWYEWRRDGWILPIVILVSSALVSIPLFVQSWDFAHGAIVRLGFTLRDSSSPVTGYVANFVRFAVFLAWILGGAIRFSGARDGALRFPGSISTKPLTTLDLAFARLKSRVWSGSIAFATLTLVVLIWLVLPGRQYGRVHDMSQDPEVAPYILLVLRQSDISQVAAAGIFFLLVYGLILRNLLVGQFARLSGSPTIAYGYMAVAFGGPVLAPLLYALARFPRPDLNAVFVVLLGVALVKLAAIPIVSKILVDRKIASTKMIVRVVCVWMVITFAVTFCLLVLSGDNSLLGRLLGYGGTNEALNPMMAAVMAILWTPYVRLAAAPLMLEFNRQK